MAEAKNPFVTIKAPTDGTGSFQFWQGEAERSKAWLEKVATTRKWDENVKSYLCEVKGGPDEVVVPKDYANVEQKKALLFFQVPEVTLTAELPGLDEPVRIFQAVLNRKLRADEVNAGALMEEVLADVLCPAGIGASKIGYEAEVNGTVPVQQPMMDPTGQPIVDPMTQQPVLTTVDMPNVVNERYFWERIPVKRLLMPTDFTGSDFDKAPWLGFTFEQDLEVVAKTYKLDPKDLKPSGDEDEGRIKNDLTPEQGTRQRVCGTEIWYRAGLFLKDVANTEVFHQLVWFDGMDAPIVHRPSPYQVVDEQGKIVAGMRGNPVHVLTLGYVSDTPIPPSNVSVTRVLVDELSEGRTRMIEQRKRSLPINMYDPARAPQDTMSKLERGETQANIPVPGLTAADPPIVPLQKATFPRENFTFNDYIQRDMQEAWALGANQNATATDTKRTATELSIMQSATQTRMKREQTQVARWFVAGVAKLGALIQLFADAPDYVEIVGENGLRTLEQWNKDTIQGRFAYSAKPDSQLQMDAAMDRKAAMDEYQFLRKDPLVNAQALLQKVARRLGYDPAQFLAQPQPPKPEPPKPSFSFKGDDLNPSMPQFPIVMEILMQGGMQISPQAIAAAQQQATMQTMAAGMAANALGEQPPDTTHGGMTERVNPLNKHRADESGKLPGGGAAPAQGA